MSEGAGTNTSGPSTQTDQMNVKVEIVVQPPLTVGVSRRLVPPVVARTDHQQLLEDYMAGTTSVFGTLMLTASDGNDATPLLQGNFQVQGQPVTIRPSNSGGGSSSSRQEPQKWIYFIFTGLSVQVPGVYTVTVCVNMLVLAQSCVFTVGGKVSRALEVVNQAVVPAKPSRAERRILQELEDFNLYNPNV